MATPNIVVVESPAKAKTINKYLGTDFTVLASYGHVRDLMAKDGSVNPDANFAMTWEVDAKAKQRLADISAACKNADRLFLATDPDREGEAISWHIEQELARNKALNGLKIQRVVFHEITKGAILHAMEKPRDINQALVDAYLARRALDYLVGFTLSPVLWRKLPGAKSAGRVQSVALRLICEREAEIEAFQNQEYWTVTAKFVAQDNQPFEARLTHLNGRKLAKFDLATAKAAEAAVADVNAQEFTIAKVDQKDVKRNPAAPFTTSTLQQEASRKLRFGASHTMRTAQKLYEGVTIGGETTGLITYMRTDSISLSQEAIHACRSLIEKDFGKAYLPNAPRLYKTRSKNAQEAHEAIRPTQLYRHPASLRPYLTKDQFALYELIWKRTVAAQMATAIIAQMGVDISTKDAKTTLRATGSSVKFDGFLKLYFEGRDEVIDPTHKATDQTDEGLFGDTGTMRLPPLKAGEKPTLKTVEPNQHFTQPPPRYSEASLVKSLEELGIGRPSTYAAIIRVLQDRNYVTLDKRRFVPEDRGRLVVTFLSSFFGRYFEYDFTANMEQQLDDISGGRIAWRDVLHMFWKSFHHQAEQAKNLSGVEVRDTIDHALGAHFFAQDETGDTEAARKCPACEDGRLGLNFGRFGAFIACSNYPACRYTRELGGKISEPGAASQEGDYPKTLGLDPISQEMLSLRKGPYGFYVQLGEAQPKEKGKKAVKPKRASLLKSMRAEEMTLESALALMALPRDLGPHPETKETVQAGVGRYGPYLKHGTSYITLPADDDVLSVGMNRAVDIIAAAGKKTRPARAIGDHPTGGAITIQSGRFGPYVKYGKVNATIPKSMDPDTLTIDMAVDLITAKMAKKATAKKMPAKKASTKKTPAKKTRAKKSASKRPLRK